MSSFPLYDILIKDVVNEDLSLEQKKEIISTIPILNDESHRNMFILIRLYGLKNSSGNIFNIPYEGKKIDKDIKFELEKFPNVLKQLLYRFIRMHMNLKEERIDKIRN